MKNKKGQVTLFAILGLIIVGGITTFLLLAGGGINNSTKPTENPTRFISSCTKEALKETLPTIMKQGGYQEPKDYITYQGKNIAYLCKTTEDNKACINQEPLYYKHIKKELHDAMKPQIELCFETIIQEYRNKGLQASTENDMNISINILPGTTQITTNKQLNYGNEKTSSTLNTFYTEQNNNLYETIRIIETIISHETQFCDFENQAYSLIKPEYNIQTHNAPKQTKIYEIKHLQEETTTFFATRGCVIRL
jgi:hypothetical protein